MAKLDISKYPISIDREGTEKGNVRAVFLTDLHNCSIGKDNEKLIREIRNLNPDFVLVGGDLIVASKYGKGYSVRLRKGLKLLSDLAGEYPVYMCYGNHEQKLEWYEEQLPKLARRFEKAVKKTGTVLLRNKTVRIECKGRTIDITGFEPGKHSFRHFGKGTLEMEEVRERIGDPDQEVFHILLAHDPDYFELYAEWGADLILSGHLHGGLIRVPFLGGVISPKIKLFPKYDAGFYENEKASMVLGRGLGKHFIIPRLNNPAELVVLDLE